jgi:TIR domain-containing protein
LAAHADLLPQAEAEVLKRLWKEYRVNPLDLVSDGVSVEQDDAQVDVSHDRSRDFRYPGPHHIPGQRVRYYVAYKGDKPLWECRPSSFTLNTPVASDVTDNELVFEFLVAGTDIADTKLEFDEQLRRVRDYLIWSRKDVDQHNEALMPAFRDALARRRAEVEKTREGIEALGLPIRKKPTPGTPSHGPAPATTKGSTFDYDVALSFAGEDRAFVEEAAKQLRAANVRVFYDLYEKAHLWGKNLADHLGEVYGKRSQFVVLFVSKHYPLKSWPEHERQSAQARAIRERRVVLLPARFDDTEIPGLPSTTGYIDLRTTSAKELAELILKKLEQEG